MGHILSTALIIEIMSVFTAACLDLKAFIYQKSMTELPLTSVLGSLQSALFLGLDQGSQNYSTNSKLRAEVWLRAEGSFAEQSFLFQ